MKNWAIVCLCLVSSFTSANEIEEVVVKARQIKIILDWKVSNKHKQNVITKEWHYAADKEDKRESK